jgi:uncharacterized membrane protein YhaH (DUF805 family)
MSNRIEPIADIVRKVLSFNGKSSRRIWWVGLICFGLATILAFMIYESGLSRWLRKPDLAVTIWAWVIGMAAFSGVILVSIRRCNEMGCSPKWLWTIIFLPILPIWILILGCVPPNGLQAVTKGRVAAGIGALIALASGSVFYLSSQNYGSFEEAKPATISPAKESSFECSSRWDGSVRSVNRAVKNRLHDPSSFKHVETIYSPANGANWTVAIKYRAKNRLGALALEGAIAIVDPACNVVSFSGLD